VTVFSGAEPTRIEDRLAGEEPLELRIEDTPIAVLMRTPGKEAELSLGFCLTEGILLSPDEFGGLDRLDRGRYRIRLAPGVEVDPEQFRRNTYTTSSCGVCGKASIDAVLVASRPLPAGPVVPPAAIYSAVAALEGSQPEFARTGGLHGAAVTLADGTTLGVAEDIGRHNAVDKAIGAAATLRWPLGESMLIVSGRSSFEITQKAAVAGIPIVAGVSAASSLAVELANDLGMTLIGFVRGERMVVYSGSRRILGSTPRPTATDDR
jgi:FdhD protein